jgi:hypothetical protein
MTEKTFGEEMGQELTGKAVMWGPAIAGAALLGPVGFFAGLAASVIVFMSGDSDSSASGKDSTASNAR